MAEWPKTPVRMPVYRIWTRPTWSTGSWQQVAPAHGSWRLGGEIEQVVFPAIAELELEFVLGHISGQVVSRADAPAIDGHEIVVQLAYRDANRNLPTEDSAWLSVFWGRVVYSQEIISAAADHDDGVIRYRCVDGLARLFDWPIDEHQVTWGATSFGSSSGGCPGHPGFNTGDSTGRPTGNRHALPTDPFGLGYAAHVHPGAGTTWSDRQVIEWLFAAAAPPGDIALSLIDIGSALEWLDGANVWEVRPGDTAGDLLARILDRRRGLGIGHLYLGGHSGDPSSLTPKISYIPQQTADLTYSRPNAGGTVTLPGATSANTDVDLDLRDDHLVVDQVVIGKRFTAAADYVETVADPLHVTVTIAGANGALAHRAANRATAFESTAVTERVSESWHPVYQHYGLSPTHQFTVSGARYDYRISDAGAIQVPGIGSAVDTSPLLIEILPYLDLLEGWDYSGASPAVHTGIDATNPNQPRLPALYALQDDGTFLPADESIQLRVDGVDIWVEYSGDQEAGTRFVSDLDGDSSLSAGMDWQDLYLTATLRMPHRLRMASGDSSSEQATVRRIEVPGLALHLIHPAAIHDLNDTISGTGYTAETNAAGGSGSTPGILRDDRDELARIHALHELWYLAEHRPLEWKRQGCGLFLLEDVTERDNPILGEVISTLTLATGSVTIDTPITRIAWDPERNVTTYSTDWVELDFG